MSPKPGIDKEAILQAAWDLVREEGGPRLNARRLASRMETSTMPIYSAFGGMAELEGLLRYRIVAELEAWQKRSWSPNALLDMAIGYVVFAKEEPRLFLYLFSALKGEELTGLKRPLDSPETGMRVSESPDYLESLRAMARDTQNQFVFRTWVFVHGLANLLASGGLSMEREEIVAHLEAAGAAFYQYHSRIGGEHGSDH
jgi:AcrR family transcriptional regulator